jgi:hypothetical protein
VFDVIAFEESAAKAAGVDPALACDAELLDAAVALERVRGLVELAHAQVLAELDERQVTEREHGHPTGRWLAGATGTSTRAATARVHQARRLRRFDRLRAAVAAGEPTFEHAASVAAVANPRIRGALADCQDELVAGALGTPFGEWQTDVRRLAALLDDDGPPPDDVTRNRLRFRETLDGLTHIDATMTADLALTVRAAVDARADDLFRKWTRDAALDPAVTVPTRATLRLLALADLASGTSTGRAEVTLVLHDHEVTDRDGNPVARAAADRWGCDPDLWAVVVDHLGIPLDLGHVPRFATHAIRRALALRDGGCRFPGCDRPPRHCDAHHLVSPLHGGTTSVDAMVLLCRHHHTALHQRGWRLAVAADGTATWTGPTGRTHLTVPRQRPRPPPRC